MKTRILLLLVALFATVMSTKASIELGEMTILTENGEPYYILVPFTNATNNYQGSIECKTEILDGKKHVGKITLTLSRINASETAQVTEMDKAIDSNFWETAYKRITKEMTGTELKMEDYTDIIVLNNVDLCNSLFMRYHELETVTLNYDEDCTIPRGLFNNINSQTDDNNQAKIKTITCNIGGNITFGEHILPGGGYLGNLKVMCTSENIAKAWYDLKLANESEIYNYKIYLNGEEYTGSTGIDGVVTEKTNNKGKIYNIAGQQVSSNSKGILIKDGKKVVVK